MLRTFQMYRTIIVTKLSPNSIINIVKCTVSNPICMQKFIFEHTRTYDMIVRTVLCSLSSVYHLAAPSEFNYGVRLTIQRPVYTRVLKNKRKKTIAFFRKLSYSLPKTNNQ